MSECAYCYLTAAVQRMLYSHWGNFMSDVPVRLVGIIQFRIRFAFEKDSKWIKPRLMWLVAIELAFHLQSLDTF